MECFVTNVHVLFFLTVKSNKCCDGCFKYPSVSAGILLPKLIAELALKLALFKIPGQFKMYFQRGTPKEFKPSVISEFTY